MSSYDDIEQLAFDDEADIAQERNSENARRMSNLLAAYYGTTGVAEPDADSDDIENSNEDQRSLKRSLSAKSRSEYDLNDINSPRFFNADKHLESLVVGSGKSYNQLVEDRDSLKKEINKLDSSMKELVSSNYTKFIDGSTLIRDKTNNELINMEKDIYVLQEKMEGVNTKSELCESRLAEGRNRLEVLAAAKPMMRKLLAVMALPKRIRTLESTASDDEWDIYEDVIDDIRHAWPVLLKYGIGNPKLRETYEEIREIKEKIEKKLWIFMLDNADNLDSTKSRKILAVDACDIGKMLVRLPDIKVEDVIDAFVRDRIALISSLLKGAESALCDDTTLSSGTIYGASPMLKPLKFLSEVNSTVLGEVLQTYDGFHDLIKHCKYEHESREIVDQTAETVDFETIEQSFNSLVGDVYNNYVSFVVGCSKTAAEHDLRRIQHMSQEVFGPKQFTEFLQMFASDVSRMIVPLFPNQPMTEIGCRLCEQMALERIQHEERKLAAMTENALEQIFVDLSLVISSGGNHTENHGYPLTIKRDEGNSKNDTVYAGTEKDTIQKFNDHIANELVQGAINAMSIVLEGRPRWNDKIGPERALSWKQILVITAKQSFTRFICICTEKVMSLTSVVSIKNIEIGRDSVPIDICITGHFALTVILATCISKKVIGLIHSSFSKNGILGGYVDEDAQSLVDSFELDELNMEWEVADVEDHLQKAIDISKDRYISEVADFCQICIYKSGASYTVKCMDYLYRYTTILSGGIFEEVDLGLEEAISNQRVSHVASSLVSGDQVRSALGALAGKDVVKHDLAKNIEAAMNIEDEEKDSIWEVTPRLGKINIIDDYMGRDELNQHNREDIFFRIYQALFRKFSDSLKSDKPVDKPLDSYMKDLNKLRIDFTLLVCRISSYDGLQSSQALMIAIASDVFLDAVLRKVENDGPQEKSIAELVMSSEDETNKVLDGNEIYETILQLSR